MTTDLHEARLAAVIAALKDRGVRSVADLGCGYGALLLRLAADPFFSLLAGLEVDAERLRAARARSELAHVAFTLGSMTDAAALPRGFDAAVMVETLEHLPPDRLGAWEAALLGEVRPRVIVLTTPNVEFNPLLGVPAGRMRRPDHRFEWDRTRFRAWAGGVAARRGYAVAISDAPAVHANLGGPSQMAVFERPA